MWRKWIVTLGGAGLSPFAPGTAGSLVAAALALGFMQVPGLYRPVPWMLVLLAGAAVFSALSVRLGRWSVGHFGRKDPGAFVLDEAAGLWVTFIGLPIVQGWRQFAVAGSAFFAFRLFDILKPPPARQLERLPAGWGILCDDLMAGVYANLVCQVFLRLVLAW